MIMFVEDFVLYILKPRLSVPRRVSREASTDEYSLGTADAKAEEGDREPER